MDTSVKSDFPASVGPALRAGRVRCPLSAGRALAPRPPQTAGGSRGARALPGLRAVVVALCACLATCAALAQGPMNGGGPGGRGGGPGGRGGHFGSGLHSPWIGSGTYERNLERGRGGANDGRGRMQRDVDSIYDRAHNENARARRIRDEEENRAEMRQQVRNNKVQIEENRRRADEERAAREAARHAETERRNEEYLRDQERRRADQERVHDAILAALPLCSAHNADGSPCTRKCNPGQHFCAIHVRGEQK